MNFDVADIGGNLYPVYERNTPFTTAFFRLRRSADGVVVGYGNKLHPRPPNAATSLGVSLPSE